MPFTNLFQFNRTAMVMIDPLRQGHPIVCANEAFARLTGYAPDEARGRDSRFLDGEHTDDATIAAIDAAFRDGEGLETEILSYRKDGSSFWNALVLSPIPDDRGRLRYFLVTQRDISANRRAEAALNRTKHDLEAEVERRTKDLQAALDQKTALLHEVDHRVKNSLQVISSLVLLKARRIKNADARRAFNELAERVNALAGVHRLLYTAGDVSRFDLSEFAAELGPERIASLPPGQVALDLRLSPVRVPAARAATLALLLNELIGNAVKHAFPDGRKGTLTIEIGKIEKELRIVVADDGVGLHHTPPPEGSFGKTLIEMLVRQSRGQLAFSDAAPGTRAEIVMPLDTEETQFEYR